MEKLFFSTLTALLFLCCGNTMGQQDAYYCIFQVEGVPMLDDKKVLDKGMFVRPNNFLTLGEKDHILLMDQDGFMYEIRKKAIIPYARIKRYTKKEKQSVFTIKYLKYVWKRLWEREERDNIGVVFRSPLEIPTIGPLDSTLVMGEQIEFRWLPEKKGELSHFFLRESESGKATKIALNGDRLVLPVQKGLLNKNSSYQWSVGKTSENDGNDLSFKSFTILDAMAFKKQLEDYTDVIEEFQALGLSKAQIQQTLCEDVKLCGN